MAFVLAGLAIIVLRAPGSWSHPGLYAEDGLIFFKNQVEFGWAAAFMPYNGYIHLAPRLAAQLAAAAPVSYAPWIYWTLAAIVQSLCASFFLFPRNRVLVRSDALRLAAAAMMLVNFDSGEMLLGMLPVQWFLMPVALLMLCHLGSREMPLTPRLVAAYCVSMTIIGLTAPLLLVVSPVAAWLLVWRARGWEKCIPACLLACVLIQAVVFVKAPSPAAMKENHAAASGMLWLLPWVGSAGAWVYRDLFRLTLGEPAEKYLAGRWGEYLAGLAIAGVLTGCVYIFKKAPRPQSGFLLCGMALSAAFVVSALAIRSIGGAFPDLTHYTFFAGVSRYFYVPGWLLLLAGAMLMDWMGRGWSQWARVAAFVAIFGCGTWNNFAADEFPDEHWAANAPAIDQWKIKRARHEPMPHVRVPIIPDGWSIDLPAR